MDSTRTRGSKTLSSASTSSSSGSKSPHKSRTGHSPFPSAVPTILVTPEHTTRHGGRHQAVEVEFTTPKLSTAGRRTWSGTLEQPTPLQRSSSRRRFASTTFGHHAESRRGEGGHNLNSSFLDLDDEKEPLFKRIWHSIKKT
jgi:hypothetical protein